MSTSLSTPTPMKRLALFAMALLFLASCQKNEIKEQAYELSFGDLNYEKLDGRDPIPASRLADYFAERYQEEGDLLWTNQDDYHLWSAVKNSTSDTRIAIGYKPAGMDKNISDIIAEVNVNQGEWLQAREALIDYISEQLQADPADVILHVDPTLPQIEVRSDDYDLIAKLRRCEQVRYVEPLDYDLPVYQPRSSFGCAGSSATLNPADYVTVSPGSKVPWSFYYNNIPAAWNLAQGDNITVAVIDAGFSSGQFSLNAGFDDGWSTGRSIAFDYTRGSSAFNSCAHGTSMAGLIAAPRNNLGNAVGVAYKADVLAMRACDDVVLNGWGERRDVRDALTRLGNNSSVRIVSMSLGWIFGSSYLRDGVDFANGRGKLVFAAAGTSFNWTSWWGVIYPARYNSAVAVTGLMENNDLCDECHWGSQVDFTVFMQRTNSNDRRTLALPQSGNTPTYVGGSSSATATTAGIAALVWSANPNLSNSQVLNILQQAGEYYPSRNNRRGYGRIDALQAVQLAQAAL